MISWVWSVFAAANHYKAVLSLSLIIVVSAIGGGYPASVSGSSKPSPYEAPLTSEEVVQIFDEFVPLWEQYVQSADGGWKNNDNGRFTWDATSALDGLSLLYRLTSDSRYLDYSFEITDSILSSQDTAHGIRDEWRDNQVLAAWSSTRYTYNKAPHVFTGGTGFIIYALAQLYNDVSRKPPRVNTVHYREKAAKVLSAAEAAYESVEGDWRQVGPDSGYFRDPYFESINLAEPLNLFCLSGLASLELYRATGDVDQLKQARQTASYLKTFLVVRNGALLWPYNRLPPYEPLDPDEWPYPSEWADLRPDDQSHGALVGLFMIRCHESGIGFNKEHIDQLVKTMTMNIHCGRNRFSRFIDGLTDQTDDPAACWGYLSPYSKKSYRLLKTYHLQRVVKYDPNSFLNHFGSVLIQWYGLMKYYAWTE